EDLKNLNTQQSFSSFLTNMNCGTSGGSSFLDDKKKIMYQNYPNNDIHAKSVDLSNQSPFKLNSTPNLYNKYNANYNYYTQPYVIDEKSIQCNLANNPYYSFCHDNMKNNFAYLNNKVPINMKLPLNDERTLLDNV